MLRCMSFPTLRAAVLLLQCRFAATVVSTSVALRQGERSRTPRRTALREIVLQGVAYESTPSPRERKGGYFLPRDGPRFPLEPLEIEWVVEPLQSKQRHEPPSQGMAPQKSNPPQQFQRRQYDRYSENSPPQYRDTSGRPQRQRESYYRSVGGDEYNTEHRYGGRSVYSTQASRGGRGGRGRGRPGQSEQWEGYGYSRAREAYNYNYGYQDSRQGGRYQREYSEYTYGGQPTRTGGARRYGRPERESYQNGGGYGYSEDNYYHKQQRRDPAEYYRRQQQYGRRPATAGYPTSRGRPPPAAPSAHPPVPKQASSRIAPKAVQNITEDDDDGEPWRKPLPPVQQSEEQTADSKMQPWFVQNDAQSNTPSPTILSRS